MILLAKESKSFSNKIEYLKSILNKLVSSDINDAQYEIYIEHKRNLGLMLNIKI